MECIFPLGKMEWAVEVLKSSTKDCIITWSSCATRSRDILVTEKVAECKAQHGSHCNCSQL